MKTIVITDVKFKEFPDPNEVVCTQNKDGCIECELVKSYNFRNSRNERVCIGMLQEQQQVLGIPLITLENIAEEREKYHKNRTRIRAMSFVDRLIFLFKGGDLGEED